MYMLRIKEMARAKRVAKVTANAGIAVDGVILAGGAHALMTCQGQRDIVSTKGWQAGWWQRKLQIRQRQGRRQT